MVKRAAMESKTEGTMWKSIKICIRNWCQKYPAFCLGPTIKKTHSDPSYWVEHPGVSVVVSTVEMVGDTDVASCYIDLWQEDLNRWPNLLLWIWCHSRRQTTWTTVLQAMRLLKQHSYHIPLNYPHRQLASLLNSHQSQATRLLT